MDSKEREYRQKLNDLNLKLSSPNIYKSSDYPKLAQQKSHLDAVVDLFDQRKHLKEQIDSSRKLVGGGDKELSEMAEAEMQDNESKLSKLNAKLAEIITPSDPNNSRDVIMEIRAAAGGDEASIFAADLYRMYSRWAELHGYSIELLNESPNEVGGFKEISFMVHGTDAYKNLKFEAGVHRVQRIPATESQGRIHTSTVTVAVLPEADETEIDINPADIRIDVFRSSGHGGQSVNTTDSAVRITHLPTGIVVANQDEKSQIKNKAKAMSVLRSRLLQMKIEEEHNELSEARRKLIGSGDRSEKIRTYNYPQDRITDHRISYSRSNLPSAMNGDIDDLIQKLLSAEHDLINKSNDN